MPPLTIGTAHFGDPQRTAWHLGEDDIGSLVRGAIDRGLVFFDTATSYGGGLAEQRLGAAIEALGVREETLIATKVFFPTGPGPNDRGLSRRHLLSAVDSSLARLRTDRIDLLYIHRWDGETPIEETLAALDHLVRSGRVRYLGASSMSAWRLMKAVALQRQAVFSPFVAMQGHYNLLYREEEREMIPMCREEGLGYLAWSPLARGLLAGSHADARRLAVDRRLAAWRCEANEASVLGALDALAEDRGELPAALAIAWLRARDVVPVVGASSVEEIDVALRGLAIELGREVVEALEEGYRARPVLGFDPAAESATALRPRQAEAR